MSELLLELFSEEIPARMQKRASEDLQRLVTDALKAAGVTGANARAFATPRRLALVIDSLPDKTPDVKEERKGPKVGAPQQAIDGFLRAAGLTSIDQATVQEDKKGAFYLAVTEKPGRDMADLIAEIVPEVIRNFPWPKSMRWGTGTLRWVRPLHSILCILDGKVVPIEFEGISSDSMTYGHRFMSPDGFNVKSFAEYEEKLKEAKVILDPQKRIDEIREVALFLAQEAGLHLVEDEALLQEVAGLVEWPVPLMGRIDDEFMSVPQEVLTSTMRANQKYFALVTPFETTAAQSPQGEDKENKPHPEEAQSAVSKDGGVTGGKLAPNFIVVANIAAHDGGEAIVNGNERVLRARFADARFLWDQDRKQTLTSRLPKLQEVVFHAKLGSVHDKAMRIGKLARELAAYVPGADAEKAQIAGELCKADLTTGMVGEFPELQGLMGAYYARNDGLDSDIAQAIAEHYSPLGPTDDVPASALGKVVALADKLDTLAGFWAIDEKPTGSKDPFALRRSSLGVIRIVLDANVRLNLSNALYFAVKAYGKVGDAAIARWFSDAKKSYSLDDPMGAAFGAANVSGLLEFLKDRLTQQLRDRGVRHDLVDAVFALATDDQPQDDLILIVKRVEALSDFLGTEDGRNLLAGYKRAVNILKIEEKKDGKSFDGAPDSAKLVEPEEKSLAEAIEKASSDAESAVKAEDFVAAMGALALLRAPVDAFFEKVKVNDEAYRENRLRLLAQIRAALHTVADFSKVEG